MLEQIIDDFYPTLRELNKSIKLNYNESISINGDPDKLSRVFNNLIKNAISYSKEESEIVINLKKDNNNAIVEVINKGKQISKEKLSKIFEKFYRLDSARTSRTGGSGLGLAIAKDIVDLLSNVRLFKDSLVKIIGDVFDCYDLIINLFGGQCQII